MPILLSILASPRGEKSFSGQVVTTFSEGYREAHPHAVIETLDLWDTPLPEFDALAAAGKYKAMRGQPHSEQEALAWRNVKRFVDAFMAYDGYIVSCPMWNFTVPYKLKHYIDIVVQPGLTFSGSPEKGYQGLLSGKPAQLILARGGSYGNNSPADHQKPYLEQIFAFIGCNPVRSLVLEPTIGTQEEIDAHLVQTLQRARDAGRSFATV